MEEGTEFYLDLKKDRVVGIEEGRNSLVVAAMIEGIKLGHEFPAIKVGGHSDGSYIVGDGHHRVLAHYRMEVSCRAIISEWVLGVWGHMNFISLDNVILGGGEDRFSRMRLKESLGYLPEDVAERFCNENGLDVGEYLSQ